MHENQEGRGYPGEYDDYDWYGRLKFTGNIDAVIAEARQDVMDRFGDKEVDEELAANEEESRIVVGLSSRTEPLLNHLQAEIHEQVTKLRAMAEKGVKGVRHSDVGMTNLHAGVMAAAPMVDEMLVPRDKTMAMVIAVFAVNGANAMWERQNLRHIDFLDFVRQVLPKAVQIAVEQTDKKLLLRQALMTLVGFYNVPIPTLEEGPEAIKLWLARNSLFSRKPSGDIPPA